jgi:hypothetical protein
MSWLGLEGKDWAIVVATLVGPIAAVQAQKFVERARQRMRAKEWVFHTLMAYRGARMNPEFVRALNTINIAFYGHRRFGRMWRTKREQKVLDAWNQYMRHVSQPAANDGWAAWNATTDELLVQVLSTIGEQIGYEFDRDTLKAGNYTPQGQVDLEREWMLLRRGMIGVLDGRFAIPVELRTPPIAAAAEAQPPLPLHGGGPGPVAELAPP